MDALLSLEACKIVSTMGYPQDDNGGRKDFEMKT